MDMVNMNRYSEAFKETVVKEYEAGESIEQLRQRYGSAEGQTQYGD